MPCTGWTMLKSVKCLLKGHVYVDSRSQPGTQVCVRCRYRKPFEGFTAPSSNDSSSDGVRARNG